MKNMEVRKFFQWLSDFKKENAEILKDFDGLPLPPKEYPDEAYENKIKNKRHAIESANIRRKK